MYRFFIALSVVVLSATGALAQALPVPSYWKNQRGSEMGVYTAEPKGGFAGKFVNRAEGFACQGTPFDLHGTSHGHYVHFTVVWKNATQDCKSRTSWSGHITGNTMSTWWVLTYVDAHGKTKKMHGADTFKRE